MILNKINFLNVLKSINTISLFRIRDWDKIYNKKTVFDLNYEIWLSILSDCNIKNNTINEYEFYNYTKIIFTYDESLKLFRS